MMPYDEEAAHFDALTRTGFYGAQGAGSLILATDTRRVLLPLRSPYVEQPDTWGTWGGAVNRDETPQQTALREIHEETAYDGPVRMVPLYVFRKNKFAYHNFLALVPHEFVPHLNWESSDYRWTTIDDLPEPLHFGMVALLNDQKSRTTIEKYTAGAA